MISLFSFSIITVALFNEYIKDITPDTINISTVSVRGKTIPLTASINKKGVAASAIEHITVYDDQNSDNTSFNFLLFIFTTLQV